MHAPFLSAELQQGNNHDDHEQHNGARRGCAEAEIAERIQIDGVYDQVGFLLRAARGEQLYQREGLEGVDDIDDDLENSVGLRQGRVMLRSFFQ